MKENILAILALSLSTLAASNLGCSDGGDANQSSSSSSAGAGGSGGQGGGSSSQSSGSGGQGGQGGGGTNLCADRTGGALITFDVAGESFTVWITSGPFIDEAITLKEQGMQKVPVFEEVIDGQDCDPVYTFHVDPAKASFADATIELCDGTPSYIDMDTATWISQVKSYCPWSAKVTNVDDRR